MEIRTLGIFGIQVTLYISARGGTKEYRIHHRVIKRRGEA